MRRWTGRGQVVLVPLQRIGRAGECAIGGSLSTEELGVGDASPKLAGWLAGHDQLHTYTVSFIHAMDAPRAMRLLSSSVVSALRLIPTIPPFISPYAYSIHF